MFGLKPPLYYLPGKRAVRLLGSCAAPARPGSPPHPSPPDLPSLGWCGGSAEPLAGGRAQPRLLPLRSSGWCVCYVRREAPTRPPPPPRRRRGLLVSLLLSAGSWLRGGGAARGRSTQALRGELSTGCEVTFLQANAIVWHAPSPAPSPRAYFPLLPGSPVRGLCASVACPPPPPAPLPARDSLEGSVPAEVGGGGRGKLGRVVCVASCFPNLLAR